MDEEALDALIRERLQARSENGEQKEYSEQEIAAVRNQVMAALSDDSVKKVAACLRDGKAAEQFREMNLAIGIPGGKALIEAIINNCPGFTANRRRHLVRQIKVPKTSQESRYGVLEVTVPERDGAPARTLYLRCGPCKASHDMGAQLKHIEMLSEEEQSRIKNQFSHIILFGRQAYFKLLELNKEIIDECKTKLGDDPGVKLDQFYCDESNSTLYLARRIGDADESAADESAAGIGSVRGSVRGRIELQKWEPRMGLFIDRRK